MKKTIEEFKNQKNELNSIIVYSIVLGISINIISSILSEMFDIQLWFSLIIWVSISLSVIVVSQIIKLYRLKTSIEFDCLFISDESKKNKLIGVPNYKISTDMKEYFESAFSENSAYKTIWEDSGLDKLKKHQTMATVTESKKLLVEMLEYCLLEHFSIFIGDYYNTRNITKKIISCSGNDIPDVLLKNRFLKLFSEDPKNRAAFCTNSKTKVLMIKECDGESKDEGTVVFMTGSDGAIYRRFALNIPKGSKVFREKDDTIVIDTKLFTVKYKIVFDGFSTVVERDFYKYYLHETEYQGFHDWKYIVEFDVKYKISSLLKLWDWKYYNWLDEYLVKLANYYDVDTFYKNIGWEKSKTILRILKTPKPDKYNCIENT